MDLTQIEGKHWQKLAIEYFNKEVIAVTSDEQGAI